MPLALNKPGFDDLADKILKSAERLRGKFKAYARLLQFIEAVAINAERFRDMVRRHGLLDWWQTFERRFLQDSV
jgi:hypothetical protein